MSETPRRNLLALGGISALMGGLGLITGQALAVPASAPTSGGPGDDAALLVLDREAERFHTFEGLDGRDDDDPAFAEFAASWVAAIGQLSAMPAHTLPGIFVKVKWALRDHFQGESAHAETMAQGLLADLARLTGLPVPKIDTAAEEAAHG